jgi:hypothetical protein
LKKMVVRITFSNTFDPYKILWRYKRISISAHGSKWTHYRKTYFKMSKKLEQKFCMYILTCYVCTQSFRRKEHFLCPI